MTLILAAAAFMIQRLVTHWRIRRARQEGRAAIARLQSAGALTATFDDETLSLDVDGRTLRLRYADCEEAEDAGGLIYVWPRDGASDRRADARARRRRGGGAPRLPRFGPDRRDATRDVSQGDPQLLRRRRRRRGRRFDESGASPGLGGVRPRWGSRRRMQRSQMHIVAARRQRRVGENRLIRIGRSSLNGRRRGILAAKMQPSLDILGAAGQSAQHSAGLVRWRRDGRDRHRGGLRRRSLDGRGRNARDARRALLLRVGRGDLHYRRRGLGRGR